MAGRNPFFDLSPEGQRERAAAWQLAHPSMTPEQYVGYMSPKARLERAFGAQAFEALTAQQSTVPTLGAKLGSPVISEATNVTDLADSPTATALTEARQTVHHVQPASHPSPSSAHQLA